MNFVRVRADTARGVIARVVLGEATGETVVGGVRLHMHQLDAIARLRASMEQSGGALLADATGLGKTHVALVLLREAGCSAVVAPAALRGMWSTALERAGCTSHFVSVESLSRSHPPFVPFELVVVDEAHHFRNARTRRYRRLAAMTARARVLLLTATPVHNRRSDLEALLALFLGARARLLADAELSAHVIRRTASGIDVANGPLPESVEHPPFVIEGGAEIAERLLELPSPVLAADEGDAAALLRLLLHRLWASSDAALRCALRKRLARSIALREAIGREGTAPLRADLALWRYDDGALQLAFPELMARGIGVDNSGLLASIERHESALSALLSALPVHSSRDERRAQFIRDIRARHAGSRIVAFATFGATIAEMWKRLSKEPGVCALTSRGARVAGGDVTRSEALERFAPRAHGAREPRPSERIDLLLSTDLLSEGVNLQDADVAVHLDLPWTPARIAQRIGRVARLGSVHRLVHVYTLHPPPLAERALRLLRRLEAKSATAERVVGREAAAEGEEAKRRILRSWLDDSDATYPGAVVAAVAGAPPGVVMLWRHGRRLELMASEAQLLQACGTERTLTMEQLAYVERVAAGARARWAQDAMLGLSDRAGALASRSVLSRVASLAKSAPAHSRPKLLPLASRARRAVLGARSAGQEQGLALLLQDKSEPTEWLKRVIATVDAPRPPDSVEPCLVAAIAIVE